MPTATASTGAHHRPLQRFVDNDDGRADAVAYDDLGRKTRTTDPDQGTWRYQYTRFGELERQDSAAGHYTIMTYDGLGRMATRKDYRSGGALEASARWVYDTAANGLGSLAEVEDAISGYRRSISYDALGRVSETATRLETGGATHYEKATYDQHGRPFQAFDATRESADYDDHGVRFAYNAHGYLHQLRDAVRVRGSDRSLRPRTVYRTIEALDAEALDARGNVVSETLGNGVARTQRFDGRTGRIRSIFAENALAADVQSLHYQWDALGNLTRRQELAGSKSLAEDFDYDGLNRLTRHQVQGRPAKTVAYDAYGNIVSKTGAGRYAYKASRPHAVASVANRGATTTYRYDANGNNVSSSDGRTLSYTAFGKAKSITKNGHATTFAYGPDRARVKRTDAKDGRTTTTLYLGGVEKISHPDGSREIRRRIGGLALDTLTFDADGAETGRKTRYILRDHLGSVAAILDDAGSVEQATSFDPWGRRRAAADWSGLAAAAIADFDARLTTRGFTGHEMVDAAGLVHMNGRVYDPALGRFLQADPLVQFPSAAQSHNRYSYVLNNPLAFTDPSGHFIPLLAGIVAGAFKLSPVWIGVVVGSATFAETLAGGGSFGDALRSGMIAGVSSWAFASLGANLPAKPVPGDYIALGVTPGLVGGVASTLQGGRFGHGFVSSGLGSALGGPLGRKVGGWTGSEASGRLIASAVVGGTSTRLTGGKFANGAGYAAFAAVLGVAFKSVANRMDPSYATYMKLAENAGNQDFMGADGFELAKMHEATAAGLPSPRFNHRDSGLKGALFINHATEQAVLAFAGTDFFSLADWKANIKQAFGFGSSQYSMGIEFARTALDQHPNLHVVGHSLGGGIASAAAMVHGLKSRSTRRGCTPTR